MVKAVYLTLGKVTLTKVQSVIKTLHAFFFSVWPLCGGRDGPGCSWPVWFFLCSEAEPPPPPHPPLDSTLCWLPSWSQPQWEGTEPCWRGLVGSSREGHTHWDKGEGQAETIDMLFFYVEKGSQVHVFIKAC